MKMPVRIPIYLDYQATTPVDPRVMTKMIPYFTQKFGNAHSRSHQYGWEAEEATEEARKEIAKLIGASTKEVIFTSGATESNNLAIKGVARFNKSQKNHIITLVTEHKCVLDSCRHLQQEGFDVSYLGVGKTGLVDLKELESAITDKTCLISIMAVNNEIGTIQPLKEIGAICRKKNVYFHCDAAQAYGKIPLNVEEMNIDLMSISAHKIYGPKGVGALYVRKKPRIRIEALINGGGQERGMRSGTLPTPLIVGFGEAAKIASLEMNEEYNKIKKLSDRFYQNITKELSDIYLNGDKAQRYPGNLNLSFAYVEGESMIMAIKELAVSSGSACTSSSLEPSYVLRALGVDEDMAHSSIRFGIGRFNTEEEIDFASIKIIESVRKLREMSPLWEMVQEGIDIKTIEWTGH
jgi:cysteine desulfurase